MRRAGLLIVIFAVAALVPAALAQEPEKAHETAVEHASEPPAEGEHGKLEMWKWANFVVLAAGLGYLIGKNAGPFFTGRSQQIRKEMLEAQDARKQSEARAAEVDRRLASLEGEIAALRAESQTEVQAESERMSRHTASELAKIQSRAEQEIASAGKAARMELKRYTAHLAVTLAEQRLQTRIMPDTQDALMRGFVRDLEAPASAATN
jgi:F-type H+-transporting ATPase subunit b